MKAGYRVPRLVALLAVLVLLGSRPSDALAVKTHVILPAPGTVSGIREGTLNLDLSTPGGHNVAASDDDDTAVVDLPNGVYDFALSDGRAGQLHLRDGHAHVGPTGRDEVVNQFAVRADTFAVRADTFAVHADWLSDKDDARLDAFRDGLPSSGLDGPPTSSLNPSQEQPIRLWTDYNLGAGPFGRFDPMLLDDTLTGIKVDSSATRGAGGPSRTFVTPFAFRLLGAKPWNNVLLGQDPDGNPLQANLRVDSGRSFYRPEMRYLEDWSGPGHLTLNLGLRFDALTGSQPAAGSPVFADPVPEPKSDAGEAPVTWDFITPRVGSAYALEDRLSVDFDASKVESLGYTA